MRVGRPAGEARRLTVAGVASGVGKTTITCAIMAAFRRRGWRVQPFKAGPDYIDPGHHARAAGRPSRNLDSVLVSPGRLRTLFARASRDADIAVIEGVMGLFDGRNGFDEEGSTAQIAKLLGSPVVVVIDVAKTARSAGAIALGCARFDPTAPVAGFVLNRVGSASHAKWATDAVESATGLPVIGAFPRDPGLAIPERHLGLIPAAESVPAAGFMDRLADAAERHVDLDHLAAIAASPVPENGGPSPVDDAVLFPQGPVPKRTTIAVAQDEAFSFYYQDTLDLLEAWGAEIVPYSPLRDGLLPEGTRGVYLGGGFPELHASELAENTPMHESLRAAARTGTPIYGECGGLMYLGQALTDFEGSRHPMVGLAPVESRMQRRRVTLGYRSVTALRTSPILEAGTCVMGHEFHYSELIAPVPAGAAAYRIAERGDALEGFAAGNMLLSYVHLHFASDPSMARRFISACSTER
ncbi:MAG: cobyrinate a,c-diamide synthase [Chloroflexi bacterium]|nr:cobyrinate a,c-diamide synthase [Chloroflexota bacterium]